MFERGIISELKKWADQQDRKPLVLRGARQVGKTTVVTQFSRQFDHYIYLNLELPEEKAPFERFTNIETLIRELFFLKNKSRNSKERTLLFIDEIQELPEALNILRYFYEQAPDIYVISAGSLLESLFNTQVSFPVGRVEYKVLRPVSFPEFLGAIGEQTALDELYKIPVAPFAHSRLLSLFHTYAIIGGMPEIVSHYSAHGDLTALTPIYESLLVSYMDDVEKYASRPSEIQAIRHAIRACFAEAGKRIKFQGFGKSNYGSREMSEALRTIEKALLIYLVFPNTGTTFPIQPDLRKSPRLHVLDSGLLNYMVGIQKEILGTEDLHEVYRGLLIEHLVGQEILAAQYNAMSSLQFWVREKKTSMAEVDYLYPFDGKLIPVEVKSGAAGKLRSLHLFMDMAPHAMAIRFYAGELKLTKTKTPEGKIYHLLSLPYYLSSQLEHYLSWMQEEIKKG